MQLASVTIAHAEAVSLIPAPAPLGNARVLKGKASIGRGVAGREAVNRALVYKLAVAAVEPACAPSTLPIPTSEPPSRAIQFKRVIKDKDGRRQQVRGREAGSGFEAEKGLETGRDLVVIIFRLEVSQAAIAQEHHESLSASNKQAGSAQSGSSSSRPLFESYACPGYPCLGCK